ncbi:MAG: GyrI-like domain-containing protein [Gemmatimonadetes bacterium]|nr:GyrI-like domain-containing protein [Gemmatimonadota bacterium]
MSESHAQKPEEVTYGPILGAQVHMTSGSDPAEIGKAFGTAFGKLVGYIQATGAQPQGPPRAIYTAYGPGETAFTVVMPLASGAEGGTPDGSVVVDEVPGGRALRFVHLGPYEKLRDTYGDITNWMIKNGRMESGSDWEKYTPMWEEYVSDPDSTPPDELVTHIYLPLA